MDALPSEITVKNGDRIMLIDFSYYIFYRYFALISWYKKRNDTDYNMDDFMSRFARLFKTHMTKLLKELNFQSHNVYLVGDCARSKIWRHRHTTNYKSNRDSKPKIEPFVFDTIYNSILPDLVLNKKINYVCVDNAEADDVIAWIHRALPDSKKIIITNDNDYLQLHDENTELMNLQLKNIVQRGTGDAQKDLLLKILVGDASDNITGIMSNKRAMKLIHTSIEEVEKTVDEMGKREEYDRNRLLIDMKNIPDDIDTAIGKKVRILPPTEVDSDNGWISVSRSNSGTATR